MKVPGQLLPLREKLLLGWMLHQSSTEIIGAGSCWLFLLLGWAAAVNNTLPAKAQETYLQNSAATRC
jgi:hypothetical protein